jgi:methionyl-tRNA synthetase
MAKRFYLTTTLPYVNDDPHIGFALEIVQTDAAARFHRLMGDEVFFNTGTDEHGQKLFEAAQKAGQEPKAYVDHFAAEFRKLKEALDLSNDVFVRTTDPHHITAAQEMWRRCNAAGDIYKKSYEGLYCVGCERFLSERDMQDGKCVIHLKEPVLLTEENYFFRLSKYQDRLLEYLARPGVILPEWRRDEAVNFVKQGLEDFSISREKARLSWGIPVPDDDSQVMYVWFDALTNYISTLGWPEDGEGKFKSFWEEGEVLQTGGKDQIRFQSVMWQAILMSANLKNTDTVFYHGFITSGGVKMSKSLGNVINPLDVVNEYGTDALRYFLLRHVSPVEDSDVTLERIKELYNGNLANGLGNVVSRVMKMAQGHLDQAVEIAANTIPDSFILAMETYKFNDACDIIWQAIAKIDQRITEEKPFVLVKENPEAAKLLIAELVRELYTIGRMLNPLMPSTSALIKTAVKENKKPENLFPRKE